MKIYIVTDGEYSDYGIEAVFTDKKQAEMFAALHHCKYVEEWESDTASFEGDIKPYVLHKFVAGGHGMRYSDSYYNNGKITKVVKEHGDIVVYVSLDKYDFDKAQKIAQDMLAEYRAKLLI